MVTLRDHFRVNVNTINKDMDEWISKQEREKERTKRQKKEKRSNESSFG